MKQKLYFLAPVIAFMFAGLQAFSANKAPVAKAGDDREITLPDNYVTLKANSSTDADGTIVTYLWTKVSGPSTGKINNPGAKTTIISGLVAGVYTFRITVTDDDGATSSDDVRVTVNNGKTSSNSAPKADAGSSQNVTLPTNTTTLNGTSSTDTDGSISKYAWTKSSGPSGGSIASASSATTAVTGLAQGSYIFKLTVTDDDGATDTDDVTVTVGSSASNNAPPVANAGSDQTITLPTSTVTLNGGNSTDANGTITKWAWTRVSGSSSATISNASSVSTAVTGLVQGSYTFRLTVTDDNQATSTDDVTVTVNATVATSTLIRGPYLQMGSTNAVTLRWRSDVKTDSKISVGTSVGNYTLHATNSTSTKEHEVRITGLSPDTKYYYSFGSSSQVLQATSSNFFTTAPPANTTRKIRVAAFGDCGINSNNFQAGTLKSYQNYVGSNPAELMLLLGDNAYSGGTDAQYTSNFFGVYGGSILKNHVVFPAPGNHDYSSSSTRAVTENLPYYAAFSMPTAGECGGVASGTEAYYSYNWGNIHFISLDSYGYETTKKYRLYDTASPQVLWLKKDLAANTSRWTVVYWHHAPYTMGSHNSDSESELVNIRQNFIRILERNGVDLVLCGHSHDYERSYLLKGHFGTESSFNLATHAVSSSSAKYDGSSNSCPYVSASGKVNHGVVYVVAGSSGADGGVQSGYPHNAMPFSVDDGGMLYFEIENNRLDAKFIRRDGAIADKFTILKDAGKNSTVSIGKGGSATLTASWQGNYQWSTGATTRSITVMPGSTTTYTCKDGSAACLTDNFTVSVSQGIAAPAPAVANSKPALPVALEENNAASWAVVPSLVKRGSPITIKGLQATTMEIVVLNDKGQKIKQASVRGTLSINSSDMHAGMYFIKAVINKKTETKKLIVTD